MHRNKFGINFDEGIPLVDKNDFDLLYVDSNQESSAKLKLWLESRNNSAVIGGQIGSGKTTMINKVFYDTKIYPDIIFHFDREGLNQTIGDFLRVILAELIDYAVKNNIELPNNDLAKDLLDNSNNDWQQLLFILKPSENTPRTYADKKRITDKLTSQDAYIELIRDTTIFILENDKKDTFIFLSGIDKFSPDSSSYVIGLKNILGMFSDYNVLFEANATHLFSQDEWVKRSEKIMIYTMNDFDISKLIENRLGAYKDSRNSILSFFTSWSGGNPRQALRLLTYYESWYKHYKGDIAKSLENSLKNTINDFFSYAIKPTGELLNTISDNGFILGSLLSLPMDKEGAGKALYGNWMLLCKENDGDKFPIKINPLAKYILPIKHHAEEPEISALKECAEKAGMSSFGLEFNTKIGTVEFWNNKLKTIIEKPIELNITEILDIIASALLSKNRKDRIIIGYKNKDVRSAAAKYLFAKSSSYEYQEIKEIELRGDVVAIFTTNLSNENIIYSFDFVEKHTEDQIKKLDSIRDSLLNFQLIWWIPYESMKEYLSKWTQLRQLFQVFVLEDELLKSLKKEDIEEDIAFFQSLEEGIYKTSIDYLEKVLTYLMNTRGNSHE